MANSVPFIIFYIIFSALTVYMSLAMDYSVYETDGSPDLSPITYSGSGDFGIIEALQFAYNAIIKFIYLATVSVRPEFVMLGIIYLALNIALIYIIIDTILP